MEPLSIIALILMKDWKPQPWKGEYQMIDFPIPKQEEPAKTPAPTPTPEEIPAETPPAPIPTIEVLEVPPVGSLSTLQIGALPEAVRREYLERLSKFGTKLPAPPSQVVETIAIGDQYTQQVKEDIPAVDVFVPSYVIPPAPELEYFYIERNPVIDVKTGEEIPPSPYTLIADPNLTPHTGAGVIVIDVAPEPPQEINLRDKPEDTPPTVEITEPEYIHEPPIEDQYFYITPQAPSALPRVIFPYETDVAPPPTTLKGTIPVF